MVDGYSKSEIAVELKTSVRWVSNRIEELRDELERTWGPIS
jgi:DNA-binding Lrp family transcriptional regulator